MPTEGHQWLPAVSAAGLDCRLRSSLWPLYSFSYLSTPFKKPYQLKAASHSLEVIRLPKSPIAKELHWSPYSLSHTFFILSRSSKPKDTVSLSSCWLSSAHWKLLSLTELLNKNRSGSSPKSSSCRDEKTTVNSSRLAPFKSRVSRQSTIWAARNGANRDGTGFVKVSSL